MTRESSNRSFYDQDSRVYDERWRSSAGAFTNRVQQEILGELCGNWTESRILEVGPGTGRFTIPLLKMRNNVTLVDLSPSMLEVAKEQIDKAGLAENVDSYIESSVYRLPFDDNSFDHALSINVFNHLERPGEALKELTRVVRNGSTLLFNYANLNSYFWPVAKRINQREKAFDQDVYSTWECPAEMRASIDEANLTLIAMLGHTHVPRAIEHYPVRLIVKLLDSASRRGTLRRFAPLHFCLCEKRA